MLLMRHTNWKKANFGVFNATELCFLGSNWWGGRLRSNKTLISSKNWYTAKWLPRCPKKGCQFYSRLLFFWLALKYSWDIRIVNATTSATNSWDTWRFVGGYRSPPSNVEKKVRRFTQKIPNFVLFSTLHLEEKTARCLKIIVRDCSLCVCFVIVGEFVFGKGILSIFWTERTLF